MDKKLRNVTFDKYMKGGGDITWASFKIVATRGAFMIVEASIEAKS